MTCSLLERRPTSLQVCFEDFSGTRPRFKLDCCTRRFGQRTNTCDLRTRVDDVWRYATKHGAHEDSCCMRNLILAE